MFQAGARTITVDNIKIPINPDFRIMCEYSQAASKGDTNALCNIAERFYFAGIPEGVTEKGLAEGIQNFYIEGIAPGYEPEKEKQHSARDSTVPCFDFDEDEGLFLAAFMSEYGIDLTTVEKLHWFTFCAYFRGLSEDCRLKRVISIRNMSLSEIKSQEERARIRKLKNIFGLKAYKEKKYATVEERNEDMKRQLKAQLEAARKGRENEC